MMPSNIEREGLLLGDVGSRSYRDRRIRQPGRSSYEFGGFSLIYLGNDLKENTMYTRVSPLPAQQICSLTPTRKSLLWAFPPQM